MCRWSKNQSALVATVIHGRVARIYILSAAALRSPEQSPGFSTMAAAAEEAEEPRLIFSVWARPPPDVGKRVKKLMENLRAEFGGPEFEPHVTVVGAIALTEKDSLEKLRSACRALKPYTIRIHSVSRGPSFFQCVYLLVDASSEVEIAS
ncbi:hypothetical protein ACLOJK_008639 [Asimina triloba]